MKKSIITGLLAFTYAFTAPVNASLQLHHNFAGERLVSALTGLSITPSQQQDIKSLIAQYRANLEAQSPSTILPIETFIHLDSTQLRETVVARVDHLQQRRYALAQLRHAIFNVLDETQQNTLMARGESRLAYHEPIHRHSQHRQRERRRNVFTSLNLTKEQKVQLRELRATSLTSRSEDPNEDVTQWAEELELIRSESFSAHSWNTLFEARKAERIERLTQRALQRQSMLLVLNQEQRETLQTRREESIMLRDLVR